MNAMDNGDTHTPSLAGPSRWPMVTAIAIGVAVIAVAVATFAVIRNDDDTTGLPRRDIAATQQMQQTCRQWLDSGTVDSSANYQGWCTHMTGWMYDQMASGQMMGPMMWGSPDKMRAACVKAMANYQPAAGDPAQWCQDMVEWMSKNMGDWNDWMMNPSMMGS